VFWGTTLKKSIAATKPFFSTTRIKKVPPQKAQQRISFKVNPRNLEVAFEA
jgi:hypothetical protein